MARYLRDIAVVASRSYERGSEFNLQTNWLEQLFLSKLPKLETNGVFKVIAQAVPERNEEALEDLVDVLCMSTYFDFDSYWAADKDGRKRAALAFLHATLIAVAGRRGWPAAPIDTAMQCVSEGPLIYMGRLKKTKTASPDGRRTAEVLFSFDSDAIVVSLSITQRRPKSERRVEVGKVEPGLVFLSRAVKDLQWIDSDRILLISRTGTPTWEVAV
jgi:hypothetical protein